MVALPGLTERHDVALVGRLEGRRNVVAVAVNARLTQPTEYEDGSSQQNLVCDTLIVPVEAGWKALTQPVLWSSCDEKSALVARTTRLVKRRPDRSRRPSLMFGHPPDCGDDDRGIIRDAVFDVSLAYPAGTSTSSYRFRWSTGVTMAALAIVCLLACVAAVLLNGGAHATVTP